MIIHRVYECESCQSRHDNDKYITFCKECTKEICLICGNLIKQMCKDCLNDYIHKLESNNT